MAIRSGLFNSVNGDRRYKADFFAEYFASFIANGVFPNPSTGLQVLANQNMTVAIKPGKAWINGYFFVNDSDYLLTIDNADGVLNRIDRIVLQLNYLNREIVPVIKKGTFASSPVAQSLQRDADAYEIALADVFINKGAVSISQANITDLRLNTELCGIVKGTVDQIDTTDLFAQYDFAFQTWFESIREILDENVAANLANKIADLDDRKAEKVTLNEHMNDYVKHPAYVTASGKNDYTVTLDPAPTSYVDGMAIVVKIGTSSDDNATINVNGLGAKQILKTDGSRVSDLKANGVYTLRYNGSAFILQGEGGDSFNGIVSVEVIGTRESIPFNTFGVTNRNIVALVDGGKGGIKTYNKETYQSVKIVQSPADNLFCKGNRIISFRNTSITVYDENLNILSTITSESWAHEMKKCVLDGAYLYVYFGTAGGYGWTLNKCDINTGSILISKSLGFGNQTIMPLQVDENYIYTTYVTGVRDQIVRMSKTNFSGEISSPKLRETINSIHVLGEYVFAISSYRTFKLRKSDLSLVAEYDEKILGASKGELYANEGFKNELSYTLYTLSALDTDLKVLRKSPIYLTQEFVLMDNSDGIRKPTFFVWRKFPDFDTYLEKIVDYGGTMR